MTRDPLRLDPDPLYVPPELVRRDRSTGRTRVVGWLVLGLAWVIGCVLLAAVIAALWPDDAAPRPAAQRGVVPLAMPDRGSEQVDTASPTGAIGTALMSGTATWYCLAGSSACTRGYGEDDLVAAIDTELGFAKGDVVRVTYLGERSVDVRIVDVCACPGDRLIDLTSGAFARLAPLGLGVIPVTVELAAPGVTLPPTDVRP